MELAQRYIEWNRTLEELVQTDPQEALQHIKKGAEAIAALQASKANLGTDLLLIKAYLWNDQPDVAFALHQKRGDKSLGDLAFLDAANDVADKALAAEGYRSAVEAMLAFAKKKKLANVERLQLRLDLSDPKTRDAALDRTVPELARHKLAHSFAKNDRHQLAKYCCRVAVEAGDFQRAVAFMPYLSEDAVYFAEFKSVAKYDPLMQKFFKSPEYKKGGPTKPANAVLARAYDSVYDAPYDTYLELEKLKKSKTELLDVLAVQYSCLNAICSDLGEHGDANLDEYGNGKISVAEFKKRRAKAREALQAALKKAKVKVPPYWKYRNVTSFAQLEAQ